jgi:hypothetical protein
MKERERKRGERREREKVVRSITIKRRKSKP